MKTLKIGIVEDDLIIAQSISEMLIESGYTVTRPAKRYSEAISMIEDEAPDLLLLDITILGKMDGVEVGRTVRQAFGIPFIFLTANTDFETIRRAKEVTPAAFLAKPITKAQLYAAVEVAMANNLLSPAAPAANGNGNGNGHGGADKQKVIFVKDGYNYRKVEEGEIVFAESEQNYVVIQLLNGSRVTMRTTISEFMDSLTPGSFLRVHRSFIVAAGKVTGLEGNMLTIAAHKVPIGKNYREEVLRALGIRK